MLTSCLHVIGLGIPPAPSADPTTPGTDKKSKKVNPLEDLINTEKIYVENLTGIIRVRTDSVVSKLRY